MPLHISPSKNSRVYLKEERRRSPSCPVTSSRPAGPVPICRVQWEMPPVQWHLRQWRAPGYGLGGTSRALSQCGDTTCVDTYGLIYQLGPSQLSVLRMNSVLPPNYADEKQTSLTLECEKCHVLPVWNTLTMTVCLISRSQRSQCTMTRGTIMMIHNDDT